MSSPLAWSASFGLAGASVPTSATQSSTAITAYVTRVYDDLFHRTPDAGGLAAWSYALANGTPRIAVSNSITSSAEYRSTMIRGVYQEYLSRTPDGPGLSFWLNQMTAGLTIEGMEAGFIASDEYYRQAGSNPSAWVTRLYQDVLGRSPSSSEVAFWVSRMATTSRSGVALGFLFSSEHLATVVDGYYRDLLGRSLDPAGRQSWVSALQRGTRLEAVIGGIIASDEYVAKATGSASLTSPAEFSASTVPGARVAALQPFASSAPWNTSLGSGARYESATSTKTSLLLTGGAAVNSANWSIAVYRATTSDPIATVTNLNDGKIYSLRVPANTQATGGTDKHVGIIEPDGVTGWEFYKLTNVGTNAWTTTRVVKTDLRGDGMADGARASGISFYIGLIRKQELAALSIKHTLAVGIPNAMLKSGPVWPARTEDRDGATAYTGSIPMGSMIAIPPSVNVDALQLTPEGKALAHALQDYGAYVLVRSSSVSLYCEQSCDTAQAQNLHNDWSRVLYPLVRVVTNSTADNVAGGGTRRVAALPELS